MGVQHFEHVGIVVHDFEAATAFILDLGLRREGSGPVKSEWVDKVVGLDQAGADQDHSPADEDSVDPSPANRLGLRHIAFAANDLDAMVAKLRDKGFDTIGDVQQYEGTFRLCYIRGPEGLIVELAERIASAEAD